MPAPHLIWDCGTAYDMFVSLIVLHEPAKYGLRGAWARGVRARLPVAQREIVEQARDLISPLGWVHSLPEPKDGGTALRVLEQVAPADRLPTLAFSPKVPTRSQEVLQRVANRSAWNEEDRAALRADCECVKGKPPQAEQLTRVLEWWSRSKEFGERYLAALRTYCEVFFAEEEMRIRPVLEGALARAQELATRLELPALLEALSEGLRLTDLPQVSELVLAPSFWSTPLLVFAPVNAERELILFGARPLDASLVPGEAVPDALMRGLKALGHPTRLRILRYLSEEPQSPTQLARRLRLRAPTVVHHLDALRMAGLVHLTLGGEDRRRYAARPGAVKTTFAVLDAFLGSDEPGG